MAAQAVAFQAALTRIGFNVDSSAALTANGITSALIWTLKTLNKSLDYSNRTAPSCGSLLGTKTP